MMHLYSIITVRFPPLLPKMVQVRLLELRHGPRPYQIDGLIHPPPLPHPLRPQDKALGSFS